MDLGGDMYRKILLIIMMYGSIWAYDSIDDALKNGVSSGDITFYSNWATGAKSDNYTKNETNDAGYLVGSVGLAYHSAFWKYLRVAVSFRATGVLYDNDRSSQWYPEPLLNNPNRYGTGDASKDFYMNDRTMLGQSYVEYFDGNTSIKFGRVFADSEWADRLIDGVWLRNRSLPNALIEVFWVKNNGYVQYNKMTGFYKVNPYNVLGLSNASFKYYVGEWLNFKIYGIANPEIFYAAGGKVSLRYNTSKSYLGMSGHFTTSFEQHNGILSSNNSNGYNFDFKAFVGVKQMAEASVGYVGTGANIGWGSLNTLGNNISPFFMWGGRALMQGADASLWYGKVMFDMDRVNFAIVYGSTKFRGNPQKDFSELGVYDRVNEVNLLLDFGFTEHFSALLNVLNTHGGSQQYYPHMTNINLGLKLAF